MLVARATLLAALVLAATIVAPSSAYDHDVVAPPAPLPMPLEDVPPVGVLVIDRGFHVDAIPGRVAGILGAEGADGFHGTHVAKTLTRHAPEAELWLWSIGDEELAGLVDALQWLLEHGERNNVRVVSFSMGLPAGQASGAVDRIATTMIEEGFLVVTSAGNIGDDGVTQPAGVAEVLTVGDARLRGEDWYVPASSSRQAFEAYSKPDLVAHGRQTNEVPGGPDTMVGTSVAAPVVSAAAARVFMVWPEATAAEVKELLVATAADIGPVGRDVPSGAGLVDGNAAIANVPAAA